MQLTKPLLAVIVGLHLVGHCLAAAEPVHTIDMTQVLVDEAGKPLKDTTAVTRDDRDCERCPAVTLGHLIAKALTALDKDIKADDLWARGALAARIRDDKTAALTNDEIAVIKKAVEKLFPSPLVIMQVWPAIDPTAKPGTVKP